MVGGECPLCGGYFYDKLMTAMNQDAPEFRGYCSPCRKRLKFAEQGVSE